MRPSPKSSFLSTLLLFLAAVPTSANAAKPNAKSSTTTSTALPLETFAPCTIRSPTSGKFFDLNPLHVALPDDTSTKRSRATAARTESWHARGYDYGANFTMNFCGGVVEDLAGGWVIGGEGRGGERGDSPQVVKGVVGVERDRWANVSAFYESRGKIYSIGQVNTEPVIRGRKLLLNYTDGSPCPAQPARRAILPASSRSKTLPASHAESIKNAHPGPAAGLTHDVQDVDTLAATGSERRKNTIISLLCEDEPTAPKASLAFLASPDECTYFFELRTPYACPAVNVAKQQVGPSGVFGLIAFITFLVYVVGGIVYQRAVMHQRGWRQLPNYALWAGIVGFVSDMFVILFSSLMRFLPFGRDKDRGFQINSNGYQRTDEYRGAGVLEDENRIIDDLNEEWESGR